MLQPKLVVFKKRSNKGMTLGLVAMCAFLVIIALAAAFQLMIYLGSSQELKNSVDAASLNVAMRAADIRVPDRPEFGFDDCGDCTGKVGISNINRLWGKAYLVAANAEEMQIDGQATGASEKSVDTSWTNAATINNSLASVLMSGASQDVAFNQMTAAKPAKLMQNNGDVQSNHDDQWSTACLYRGEESNLKMDPGELPKGTSPFTIQMNNNTWMQGYNGMIAHERPFCFTTFHSNEAPHLVSLSTFNQWKNAPVNGAKATPIPNTFKQAGSLNNSQLALNATAVAVANPMLSYYLQMPRAYVQISFRNSANWMVQGKLYKHTNYSPSTGKTWQVKSKQLAPPAKGILNGYATLGNEYAGDIYSAINAIPGDHSQIITKLLQRVKEMRPNYTQNQLVNLLKSTQYPPQASSLDLMIYCDDGCSVASGQYAPLKTCYTYTDDQGQTNYMGLPSFISAQPETQAEGTEKPLFNENTLTDSPNYCWSNIIGPYPTDKHSLIETGTVTWKPGTGWIGNLGMIRIIRTATINFTGMP